MPQINDIQEHDTSALTESLIKSAIRGEAAAFRKIVEGHQEYAYAIAFGLLRSDEAAREVVQDTFVRVWKKLDSFDRRAKFTTWLYKIVVNLCYDRMKSEKRKVGMLESIRAGMQSTVGVAEDPLTVLLNSDLCKRVMEIAGTLPAKQHLVFHLRDVNDCTMDEIAEMAGMTIGTVKANLSYARKSIREQLQSDENEIGKQVR